MNVDSPLK